MRSKLVNILIALFLLLAACSKKPEQLITKFEGSTSEKKWAISELNPDLPKDWSQYGYLTFEMNATSTQRFELRLIDTAGQRRLTIQPFQGAWVRASIPLVHFQQRNTKGMDMAAISKTARPGYWIGFSGSVGTITCVDTLAVLMRMPIDTPTLEIRNVKLTMEPQDTIFGPYPLVDEFGQWVPAEWPGKARTIEDLQTAWTAEEAELQSAPEGVSKYGGFLDKKVKATGFFRVEKVDEKWWIVDPDGYVFFSHGSCCINSRSEFSRVPGREYIFKAMPPSEEIRMPDQRPRTQLTTSQAPRPNYSFYTWNLYRRYGSDWYNKWLDITIKRMGNWGLNTVGNWSETSLGETHRIPYVVTLRGWGIETGIMGMPDVYDPKYAVTVDEAAKQQCGPRKNDPYLLGYFIGNELPWPGREQELAREILNGEPTQMQAALKKYLIDGDTPEKRRDFVHQSYAIFVGAINKAIRKYDPNHMNLGIRFGGGAPDAVLQASTDFDVFSFNNYGYTVNANNVKRFYEATGKPMIIGEFHFGVPERGMAPGLAQTANQAERAAAYSYYVETTAAHPAMVGTHWFQWIDQPATGRNDGENYNIGFVDVTDRPYPELVAASKETFRKLYDIHSGKAKPTAREALRQ
jgi:hypothetical protein